MPGLGDFFNGQTMRGRANVAKATYGTFALIYIFYRLRRPRKPSNGVENQETVPPQPPPYQDRNNCPPKPDYRYCPPSTPSSEPPSDRSMIEKPKCPGEDPLLEKSATGVAQSTVGILEQEAESRKNTKFQIVADDA